MVEFSNVALPHGTHVAVEKESYQEKLLFLVRVSRDFFFGHSIKRSLTTYAGEGKEHEPAVLGHLEPASGSSSNMQVDDSSANACLPGYGPVDYVPMTVLDQVLGAG